MRSWRIAIGLFVLLIVQAAVIPFLGLPLAQPDLVLLLTIYVGLGARAEKATLTGFFAGIGQDAFSVAVPGLHSFAKSLTGFLTVSLRRSFLVNNFLVQLLAVVLLTAVHALILFWMGQAILQKSREVGAWDYFSGTVGSEIVANLVFWLLLRPLLRRVLPSSEEDRY